MELLLQKYDHGILDKLVYHLTVSKLKCSLLLLNYTQTAIYSM